MKSNSPSDIATQLIAAHANDFVAALAAADADKKHQLAVALVSRSKIAMRRAQFASSVKIEIELRQAWAMTQREAFAPTRDR